MSPIALCHPWQERFTRERLLSALGALTAGGIVEVLQPIGSLSALWAVVSDVSAWEADARLDIGLAGTPRMAALGADRH